MPHRFAFIVVLYLIGLACITTSSLAQLTVQDIDPATEGIQVNGVQGQQVTFTLTITFAEEVRGFDNTDIKLITTRVSGTNDVIVQNGAEVGPVSTTDNVVYTSEITAVSEVEKVWIRVSNGAARTLDRVIAGTVIEGEDTPAFPSIEVDIVRTSPPPGATALTLAGNTQISNTPSFTFTLTANTGISLTAEDIKITGGSVESITSNTAKNVWTVTIARGIGKTVVIVSPDNPAQFTFPRTTFTVNTTIPIGTGNVTISEIMFASNGTANQIQWIELYNSSKTEAVALNEGSGWELIIENFDDPKWHNDTRAGTINFKRHGGLVTILPKQTVLIVSARGRNSNANHFPDNRILSVYGDLREEFAMSNWRAPFLHPEGFHIKLVNSNGKTIDEAGNLDGRTQTRDKPAWRLPTGRTENEHRTSIIRQYRVYNPQSRQYTQVGTAHDGTTRTGWIVASKTNFKNYKPKHRTWYGVSSDIGSPGYRDGLRLPVELTQFRPELTDNGIVITWTTESELNNAGFNILRSNTQTGIFHQINSQLIQGAGTTGEQHMYEWTDTTAKPNVIYYYRIEDVSFAGERQTLATTRLKGLISAKGKLIKQWAHLKVLR